MLERPSPRDHRDDKDFWDQEGEALTNAQEKREMRENELERRAATDRLTGTLNRRGFEERVREAYDTLSHTERHHDPRERAILIALADIDKFKNINDTFGHDAGDAVLRAVSRCFRDSVRAGDTVGRWGGEEFVFAFVNGPEMPADEIAERLRTAVEQLDIEWKGTRIPVTISIGIADGESSETFDEAIAAADRALYTAKEEGRNRVALSSEGAQAEERAA